MKLHSAFVLAAWLASTASGLALDAAPAPKVKTLGWTFATALGTTIPRVEFTDTTAKQGLEFLDDSMGHLAGFYLKIDATAVEDRLETKLISKEEKNVPWITMLGIVADRVDANIVVEPGVFRLVPRPPPKPEEKK